MQKALEWLEPRASTAMVNSKHSSTPSRTTVHPHTKAQSLLIKKSSLLIKKITRQAKSKQSEETK